MTSADRLAVRSQNDNQGPGFTLGGTVINRKFLTLTGFRLAGSFTTLYAILMAMGDDSAGGSAGGDDACELTEAQLVSIRAAMFGRNASCSYNMTVGSALLSD